MSLAAQPNVTGLVSIAVKLDGKDGYFDWRTAVQFTLAALDLWQYATGLVERSSDDQAEDAKVASHEIDQRTKAASYLTMTLHEQRRFNGV
jgi:hypothetical protein